MRKERDLHMYLSGFKIFFFVFLSCNFLCAEGRRMGGYDEDGVGIMGFFACFFWCGLHGLT